MTPLPIAIYALECMLQFYDPQFYSKSVISLNFPEPLFVDPYAGCFVSPNVEMDMKYHQHQHQHQYCLATRFIDDKLLSITKKIDGVKQVKLQCIYGLTYQFITL